MNKVKPTPLEIFVLVFCFKCMRFIMFVIFSFSIQLVYECIECISISSHTANSINNNNINNNNQSGGSRSSLLFANIYAVMVSQVWSPYWIACFFFFFWKKLCGLWLWVRSSMQKDYIFSIINFYTWIVCLYICGWLFFSYDCLPGKGISRV